MRNAKTSKRLQLITDLTLERAIAIVRQAEIQAKEGKLIRQEKEEEIDVNRVAQNNQKQSSVYEKKPQYEAKRGRQGPCYRCGFSEHEDVGKCPALRSICRNCRKMGHWDRVCRSQSVRRLEEEVEEDSDDSVAFLGAVSEDLAERAGFSITLRVPEFSRDINFIIDTGADISCIAKSEVPTEFINKIQKTDKVALGPDGKKLTELGFLKLYLRRKMKISSIVYVFEKLKQNLLENRKLESSN